MSASPLKRVGQATPVTTPTRFLESSSVLNEIYEDSDTDSSMEFDEETVIQMIEVLPVEPVLPEVLPESKPIQLSASQTDEDTVERVPVLPLTHFQEIVTQKFSELSATLLMDTNGITLLQVTHILVHNHPPAGYVHRVRVIFLPEANGYRYDLQVLLTPVENGVISNDEDFTQVCNRLLWSQ